MELQKRIQIMNLESIDSRMNKRSVSKKWGLCMKAPTVLNGNPKLTQRLSNRKRVLQTANKFWCSISMWRSRLQKRPARSCQWILTIGRLGTRLCTISAFLNKLPVIRTVVSRMRSNRLDQSQTVTSTCSNFSNAISLSQASTLYTSNRL